MDRLDNSSENSTPNASDPNPQPEVVHRFAGFDGTSLDEHGDVADAILRRLAQISGITQLMGRANECRGLVADDALANCSWAVADLLAEAEVLTNMLWRMPVRPQPKPLTAI